MNISDLNKLIQSLTSYDLTPFDQDGLTYTRLKDGNMLNIYATDSLLMLFMQVEVLGNAGDEHPEIFRELLHQKNSRAETSDLSLRRSSANSGYIS